MFSTNKPRSHQEPPKKHARATKSQKIIRKSKESDVFICSQQISRGATKCHQRCTQEQPKVKNIIRKKRKRMWVYIYRCAHAETVLWIRSPLVCTQTPGVYVMCVSVCVQAWSQRRKCSVIVQHTCLNKQMCVYINRVAYTGPNRVFTDYACPCVATRM